MLVPIKEATRHDVVLFSGGIASGVMLHELAMEAKASPEMRAITAMYAIDVERGELAPSRMYARAFAREIVGVDLLEFDPQRNPSSLIFGGTMTSMEICNEGTSHPLMFELDAISAACSYAVGTILGGGNRIQGPSNVWFCAPFVRSAEENAINHATFSALGMALDALLLHEVRLMHPFLSSTPEAVALRGMVNGLPIEKTWSCGFGHSKHCGVCSPCQIRRMAIARALVTRYAPKPIPVGVFDPTEYEDGDVIVNQSVGDNGLVDNTQITFNGRS